MPNVQEFANNGITQENKNYTIMKLETTKERVLEAASKCSSLREALELLYPDAFEKEKIEFSLNSTNQVCDKKTDEWIIGVLENDGTRWLNTRYYNFKFEQDKLIITRK